jgi:hypothetical protein
VPNFVGEKVEMGNGRHKYLTIIELIAKGDWLKVGLGL